jgi:signal transduction histidine kinase
MEFIAALKLFGFAISAALQFSLLTLIKRERKLEKLEILFLCLISCLFFWNFGNFLLLLFAETTSRLSQYLLSLVVAPVTFSVLAFLPSLLLHIHLVFQRKALRQPILRPNKAMEWALYLPLLLLPLALLDFVENYDPERSVLASFRFAQPYAAWFSLSLLVSSYFEWRMSRETQKREERTLFQILIALFLIVAVLVLRTYYLSAPSEPLESGGFVEAVLMLWSIIPSALLGYFIFRHNFLEIAIRRSLGYPFAGMMLLLVYFLSVRYVSDYLNTYRIPGQVVQAGMILVLLPLLQPLKRWIDISVDRLFTREISRFEELASRVDDISRTTVDLNELLHTTEDLLRRELNVGSTKILLNSNSVATPEAAQASPDLEPRERFGLMKGSQKVGEVLVEGPGGKLTSEQNAALRFVAPQIVAAVETCRLVEGKIHLERELAERTRMASLGQMAATVAHNIKNPLSSIKTIVQLMQEDEGLTSTYGQDLSLINSEIDRLTHSVSQLLKFSKPTVLTAARVDLGEVLERILLIFRPDAERRNIHLALELEARPLPVRGSEEVFSEIFQNLIVNALEVSEGPSQVKVRGKITGVADRPRILIQVEDEGPGIAPDIQEKIFMPFFTTKQKGTGLGLAVVQRRVMDLSGEVTCVSPTSGTGGTRFEVTLPLIQS